MPRATRLLRSEDAPELLQLMIANRRFLEPWEPAREDDFYTLRSQHELVQRQLEAHTDRSELPLVVLDLEGEIAGIMRLSGIIRGAFQSANLGYWVSADRNGRGLATAAVAEVIDLAFGELRLHRIQAGTLLHNSASQRVLEKNGFRSFGMAPKYLQISGRWQDHILYQRLSDG